MDSSPTEPQGKSKKTGVGTLFLLLRNSPTQELNQGLLHCRWILYLLSYQGSPYKQGFSKITVDYSWKSSNAQTQFCFFFFFFKAIILFYFIFHLFSPVGGQPPHNIAVGFVTHWHESAMNLHVFPIPIPPPTSLSTQSLWVFPVHQALALVSCIQPGLVICFTLDNIHVLMLFSQNIPPSPSPTESKSLFCTSVSLFLFCI